MKNRKCMCPYTLLSQAQSHMHFYLYAFYNNQYTKSLNYSLNFILQSCELDLDEEISKVEQSEPFIVVTSKLGSATSQIFICCEGEMFLESKSMRDAIVDLMSVYYVFDISYPKPLCAMMIFLQHHVFSLEDQQTVPPALKTLISNLQKM